MLNENFKVQNTIVAEITKTVDPYETHNEPSHMELQCLNYQHNTV